MKKMKTWFAIALFTGMIVLGTTNAIASDYATPAQAVAGLTGRTIESVVSERRETGKTFGEIAAENGKLEEFQQAMVSLQTSKVERRVTNGQITQEQADIIIDTIEQNRINCDGTGNCGYCLQGMHIGGHGQNNPDCTYPNGEGYGQGNRNFNGYGNEDCIYPEGNGQQNGSAGQGYGEGHHGGGHFGGRHHGR